MCVCVCIDVGLIHALHAGRGVCVCCVCVDGGLIHALYTGRCVCVCVCV